MNKITALLQSKAIMPRNWCSISHLIFFFFSWEWKKTISNGSAYDEMSFSNSNFTEYLKKTILDTTVGGRKTVQCVLSKCVNCRDQDTKPP